MAVKPLEDRVLVKPLEKESRTESGLYLPESSKERPVQGKVVAVGPQATSSRARSSVMGKCLRMKATSCGFVLQARNAPISTPKSPMRLTTNALIAAALASGFRYQNPIRR